MSASSSFQKVGECLYRNPSSGTYYALVKVRGKQIRSSLGSNDLAEARRKLKDFKRDIVRLDPENRHLTLRELSEKFEPTFQRLAPATKDNKLRVLKRVRDFWPDGIDRAVSKVKIE